MNILSECYSLFIGTVQEFVKGIYSSLMKEERALYLANNKNTKGNGYYTRSINTAFGKLRIEIPRTRDDQFKSKLIAQESCDEAITQLVRILYKGGCGQRKIDDILMKVYGVTISHTTVSKLSKVAKEEVLLWKNRPLQEYYAAIFIDAFYFPLKRDTVEKEAVYVAIGILPNGSREILGFDIPGGAEGASNWRNIFRSFKNRGLKRVGFVVADGLTGIKNVIEEEFNKTYFQYCVLHATRSCEKNVRVKDRKEIAEGMKAIYKADSVDEARKALVEFDKRWKKIYGNVVTFWKSNFDNLTAFMRLPHQLWKTIYTTNVIERLHKEVKRRLKSMEQFQTEESANGILYILYSDYDRIYKERRINNWEYYYKKYENSIKRENIDIEDLQIAI